MNHLLDANTLIEAKNRYYGMAICPGFWQWLLLKNKALALASIAPVMDELTKGHDDLAGWAKDNSDFFTPPPIRIRNWHSCRLRDL